jgi:alpha-2-macroglobulin
MDQQSFAGRVHVEPKPAENLTISGGGTSLYIGFQSLPATTYTVTLDAGATDPYGNAIKESTTVTFSTTDLPPSLGLATRDQIALTSAYRPDTIMLAGAVNISQIDMSLSALELGEFLQMLTANGYPYVYNFQPPRITRTWTENVEAKANTTSVVELKLASDQGGKLAPGVYYLIASAPEIRKLYPQNQEPIRQMLIVSTAALTTKLAPDEFMVWVTDLKSGKPVPNAEVKVYTNYGQVVVTGKSDENGLFRAPIPASVKSQGYYNSYWVSATGEGVFALSSSDWRENFDVYRFNINQDYQPRKEVVYLYTDQPIYRPAHPVYFRGVVRHQA